MHNRGWLRRGRLGNTPIYNMSTPPPPPPGPRTPGKGCAQCAVCSTEIRLLRQRSGLAGIGPFLLRSLPWRGLGLGRGHREGLQRVPEKRRGWEDIQQATSFKALQFYLNLLMRPTEG